ncbi:hypothetical protein [Pseudactinotalea sp.]|uniref:hypothetical protein n=1 Tax=Pseudactinotalea sp. TaxID=1926260 RepID=UPI003B3B5978
MRYTFMQPEPASAAAPAEPAWASELEQRLVDRVDEWFARELDERVIRIVEDKLRDETERRAWRGGAGVF